MAPDPENRATAIFENIKPVQRSQKVREQMIAAIQRGDLKPGEALPSERKLGEAFGVSRVSVREAIRSLEALGLVEVYHGRGCFVSRGPGDRYVDPFASWLRVHKDEVFELLNVRGALDELAAQEAAQRKDAKALRRVRKARDAFAAAAERDDAPPDELVALDIAFHLAIAEAAGSTLLRRLLEDLNTQLSESRKATFMPPGRPLHSAEEHAEIVDAIVAGDGEGARTAVVAHLRAVREVLENLARQEPKVAE